MGRDSYLGSRRFRYRLAPVELGRTAVISVVGLVFMVLIYLFARRQNEGRGLIEMLGEMPTSLLFGIILGVVGLVLLIGFVKRQADAAFMMVDDGGIRCRPPAHHGQRVWTRYEWQLPWDHIERAVVYRPDKKTRQVQTWVMTTLVLQAGSREYRLGLLLWDPEDEPLERPQATSLHMGKAFHPMTESHPLIGILEHKGIEVAYEPLNYRAMRRMKKNVQKHREEAESRGHVDLMTYPSLVVMLGLIALLPIVAVTHFVIMPPLRALWEPGYLVPVVIGIAVFFGACLGMQRFDKGVPVREAAVLALILGVGVAALWNPLSMRTSVLANGESESVPYLVEDSGLFEPLDRQYPVLDLGNLGVKEYFESLERGSEHEFVLIRTGPDRFVLSLGELFDKTRAYYSERDTGN